MSSRKAEILDLSVQYQCPQRVAFWEESEIPLVMGQREGYRFQDMDGHQLWDLHLNGGTFNLGHRNREVIDAMVAAAEDFDIGNHHFPSIARAELAQDLARLTPGGLQYSVFAAGGSEAIDIAIKTARVATGRRRVVTLEHGYHGRTGLSGAAGEDGAARYFLSDQPDDFVKVPFGDLDAVARALEAPDIAAVLIESIPATYGFPIPDDDYLPQIARLCAANDVLYVADEVQAGLGRTNSLWAVESYGVEPDILVTAKGFSGGIYPIAAVVMNERAAGWLHEYGWGHVSTFGGSEIGCRVAQKTLEITTRADTVANAAEVAQGFRTGLEKIAADDSYLTEIRQRGLVMGIGFDHPNGAAYVQKELYARGVWAIASGFDHSILQWKPGLLLDPADIGDILDRLVDAMAVARDADYEVPRRHRMRHD